MCKYLLIEINLNRKLFYHPKYNIKKDACVHNAMYACVVLHFDLFWY